MRKTISGFELADKKILRAGTMQDKNPTSPATQQHRFCLDDSWPFPTSFCCLKHLQLCENLRPLLQMRFHLLPNFAKRLRWEAWHIGQVIGKMLPGREKWNTTYLDRRVQFQRSHLRGVTKSPWKFLRSNCFQSTSINLSVIPDAFQRFVTSTYFDPWPMQFMAVRFATDVFFERLHRRQPFAPRISSLVSSSWSTPSVLEWRSRWWLMLFHSHSVEVDDNDCKKTVVMNWIQLKWDWKLHLPWT